jgi:hypothetical protein
MVVGQPSVYHFRIAREADGSAQLVYRDALPDQLREIASHLAAGIRVIPMVLCDMNVLVVSSLFDPELLPSDAMDDANVLPCLRSRPDVERLRSPDCRHGRRVSAANPHLHAESGACPLRGGLEARLIERRRRTPWQITEL